MRLASPQTSRAHQLRYTGVKRDGTAVTGVHNGTGAELAELFHGRGYRQARIVDHRGWLVGGVGPIPDAHGRLWWGEV